MAHSALSGNEIAFGRAVLLATDTLGMSAEGAFWLYDSVDDKWRFFLVTSLLSRMGAREIYSRLNDALAKKLSERETEDFSFYIAAPNEPLITTLRKKVRTDSYASEPVFLASPEAWVYRLTSAIAEDKAKSNQRRFVQMSKDLARA
jgi:hypothetical protein